MKCAIVIADNIKQIMLTAETKSEKEALKYMSASPEEQLSIQYTNGTFDNDDKPYSYNVSPCQAGYLRRFAEEDSVMIVIKREPRAV